MFLGEYSVNSRKKNERTFILRMDGESNEISYKEKIPGYSDSGRYGSKHFESEITQKTIQTYIKEIREELHEEV